MSSSESKISKTIKALNEHRTKQQAVITAFNNLKQSSNWSTWFFDDATCTMQPPIARPVLDQTKLDQHIFIYWCGADNNWKDTPAMPQDGKQYKFDFIAWNWVEITPS